MNTCNWRSTSHRHRHSGELTLLLRDAPLHRLVLEFTEHAAVADYQPLRAVLDPLRSRVRLAEDAVRTGFAEHGHVVQLRPDITKVNHSLTTHLASNRCWPPSTAY